MTIYLALLRGINVGGHKKIKMADLKQTLESIGLSRVQTYIQSGNVLFESEEETARLQTKIEEEIYRVFGFQVPVMLRTSAELQRVLDHCPYSPDSLAEGDSIHVSFLTAAPTPEEIEKLPDLSDETDEYLLQGREIYYLFHQKMPDSKLPIKLQKLGAPVTVRNWNTVTKLAALARGMDPSIS